MAESNVTVYGAYWCPDCKRSKKFFGEQMVHFKWVDIEQDEAGRAFIEYASAAIAIREYLKGA